MIPSAALDAPLTGINIQNSTLRREIGHQPTLLVFLRHFGCIFCRETIKDLRQLSEKHPDYPPIVFFYQGTPEEGDFFFNKLWPGARAVSDVEKRYYDAFEIERGGMKEMFGPEVWACGVRAAAKGSFIGWKTGDPWVMPGLFLVEDDRVLWQHDFRHAGDHPDFERILDVVRERRSDPAG